MYAAISLRTTHPPTYPPTNQPTNQLTTCSYMRVTHHATNLPTYVVTTNTVNYHPPAAICVRPTIQPTYQPMQ